MQPDELKQLRRAAGLTQGQLAEMVGLSLGFIGEMERGEKPIERRTELAVRYVQLKALVDSGKVRFHAGADDTTKDVLAAMRERLD